MKISNLAERARTAVLAVSVAVIASLGLGAAAHAATPATPAFKLDPAVQAKSLLDAPAIVANTKIDCVPVDAYMRGNTEVEIDGKKVKGQIYEIACKTGPGFMVTNISATQTYQPFTCALAAKLQKARPESIVCELSENKPPYAWLQPVVQPYLPGCTISDVRLIGSTSQAPLIDRYEVGCGAQSGGIIDYPQLTATADVKIDYKNCVVEMGTTSECQFTTKAQITETFKPIAAKADKACVVNNMRFVGVTKETDGYYYEFGCSNHAGFMVLTDTKNNFTRMIPCASAAGLGGCTYTDTGAALANANTTYSNLLKAAGTPCTVSAYNVVGSQPQTKRDYVEFQCPEQPFGAIGFVPQPGADANVNIHDCFYDQINRKACTLVTADVLQKQIDKLIKIAKPGKDCDVKSLRYIGETDSADGGLFVEIACVNKRGYIAILKSDRQSFEYADPCTATLVKTNKNTDLRCQIPGNGTYATAE